MTNFQNKSFSVGAKAGEKITDEMWDAATGRGSLADAIGRFDGGSSSNPGPAASAWALEYPDKTCVTGIKGLGVSTNNQAEYDGLLRLLEYALAHDVRRMTVYGDSKLILNQAKGEWKVKDEKLKPLAARAKELIAQFEKLDLVWIPREQNDLCDALVKATIKETK